MAPFLIYNKHLYKKVGKVAKLSKNWLEKLQKLWDYH